MLVRFSVKVENPLSWRGLTLGVSIKLSDRSPAVKRCDNTHSVSLAEPHWYDLGSVWGQERTESNEY